MYSFISFSYTYKTTQRNKTKNISMSPFNIIYCFDYSVLTSLLNSVIRYLSSVLSKSSPPRYVSPFVALTCKTSNVRCWLHFY